MIDMKINKEHVRNTFADYTDNYNPADPKIKLKIDHTYRVAEFCYEIAESIGLSNEDKDVAWLSGMLHDLGRFEQIRRYGTFNDSLSIDHAKLSADLLFEEHLVNDYVEGFEQDDMRDIIELAIRSHSAYRIPEGITDREKMFCDILRDADKIDIFRVNIDTPPEEIYNVTTEDLKNSVVSDAVMQCFEEEHAVLRSLKETAIDNLVAHMALTFELVYPKSRQLVDEQGYLAQMMNYESENEITKKQLNIIKKKMMEFLRK